MQAEAALLQDDLDAGRRRARPPSRHLPRHRRRPARRDAVAAARPPGVGARRSVARHRHARARAEERGSGARLARHRPRPLRARPVLSPGRRHRDCPRAHLQGGVRAARRRRPPSPRAGALALRASRSPSSVATTKRWAALRQAERLASMVHADDVLATVCGNQANVMMMQHRHEQALALAERSVSLHEAHGSGHGLAVALATLGQICVRLGDLVRAEDALHRALDVRSPIQFHETTGAVFDTLAQIHLIRGRYETASDFLGRASEAYGAYGRQTSQWYEWSVRVLGARLALRRGDLDDAVTRADEILQAGAPPFDALQATLIAAEALTLANRLPEAEARLAAAADALDPRDRAGRVGRIPPAARRCSTRRTRAPADAYHDFSQSAALLDLLGERYQSGAQPSRARPPGRRDRRALGCRASSEQGARDLPAAGRGARPRRHPRGAVAADRRSAPASTSSPPPTPTMRSCAASSTRRRCRNCSAAKRRRRCSKLPAATAPSSTSSSPAATSMSSRCAGCEPDAGARDRALGRQRQRLRPRHHRRRAAGPASRRPAHGPGRLAAANRPSGRCGACG